MKEHLKQIRELLDELEAVSGSGGEVGDSPSFSAMEIPLIMPEIVDDLQPLVRAIVEGRDNSFDNLVTACLNCNSRKPHRPVGDFLAEG